MLVVGRVNESHNHPPREDNISPEQKMVGRWNFLLKEVPFLGDMASFGIMVNVDALVKGSPPTCVQTPKNDKDGYLPAGCVFGS